MASFVNVLASVAVASAAVKSVDTVTGVPVKGVALKVTEAVSTRVWKELSNAEAVEAEALWYSMSSGEAMEVATSGGKTVVEASEVEFKGNNSGEEAEEERDSPGLTGGGGGGVSLRSSVPLLPIRSWVKEVFQSRMLSDRSWLQSHLFTVTPGTVTLFSSICDNHTENHVVRAKSHISLTISEGVTVTMHVCNYLLLAP